MPLVRVETMITHLVQLAGLALLLVGLIYGCVILRVWPAEPPASPVRLRSRARRGVPPL